MRLTNDKFCNRANLITKMVRLVGKNLHLIRDEIARWTDILAVPYQEYLLSK